MKTSAGLAFLTTLFLLTVCACSPRSEAESEDTYAIGPQPDGSYTVPTDQVLTPAGQQVLFPGRPTDLALGPAEKILAVKNNDGIVLVSTVDFSILQHLRLPRKGMSFTGILWARDGRTIYSSDGRGYIQRAEVDRDGLARWLSPIALPAADEDSSAPGGMAFSADGRFLYVALCRNNTLGLVSLETLATREIPVGVAPYTVVLAPGNRAYVSNWGGRRAEEGELTALSSGTPTLVDPETGVANSGTVSVIDLAGRRRIRDIQVALHPCGMALSPDSSRLYVACANSDTISVIDTRTDQVVESISVRPNHRMPFGSGPNAVSVSPDGSRLYVADGTDNAVCVVALGRRTAVLGYIPTAWYPGAVILDRSGQRLYVANVKGIGSRERRGEQAGYSTYGYTGSVSLIQVPDRASLAAYTLQVESNNHHAWKMARLAARPRAVEPVPVPERPGEPSVFKHVIYIIKENRTYDQVFGDLPQGNGDTSLVHFGRDVTPNHHALAETFVLLDNFYCSGVLSADGHQWTNEAYVTDYLEKMFGYFSRSYPYEGDDPLAFASTGFIWDGVLKRGLSFRDYGEFIRARITPASATWKDIYRDYLDGTARVKVEATTELHTLRPYICPTFIGFPAKVQDVYRVREFLREFRQYEARGDLPSFIIMLLPADHTAGTRPGFPTPRAMVADNDLALGRVVEAVSHSRFWKETAIFVTEDDPQNGLDHVDGHRTVGFVISPYTPRGKVVSVNYSQVGMVRTMELILGLPPMNQLDLAARPMLECFTAQPDFSPYEALPNIIPLDEMNPELTEISGPQLHWARVSLELPLDDIDEADESTLNHILWHSVKGYNAAYPAD
ncbi:MAG: beta-propeller fold lactonase family protein [Candidatus Glassbacteria bacterium]|nr:beta-propeller fold lactonase family protein [Candidatus Glassbacteria bacterium]